MKTSVKVFLSISYIYLLIHFIASLSFEGKLIVMGICATIAITCLIGVVVLFLLDDMSETRQIHNDSRKGSYYEISHRKEMR